MEADKKKPDNNTLLVLILATLEQILMVEKAILAKLGK